MHQEEWRPIAVNDNYIVSSLGRVMNKYGRLIVSTPNSRNNYRQVVLWRDSKASTYYLHRIVAEAFMEDFDPNCFVIHKDNDLNNNRINNLIQTRTKRNGQKTK